MSIQQLQRLRFEPTFALAGQGRGAECLEPPGFVLPHPCIPVLAMEVCTRRRIPCERGVVGVLDVVDNLSLCGLRDGALPLAVLAI